MAAKKQPRRSADSYGSPKKKKKSDLLKYVTGGAVGATTAAAKQKVNRSVSLYKQNVKQLNKEIPKYADAATRRQTVKGNKKFAAKATVQNKVVNPKTSSRSGKTQYNTLSPARTRPPRTGPGSGGGARSLYNRLTGGGLNKHGR